MDRSWAAISDIGGMVNRLMTREHAHICGTRDKSREFPLQCEIVLLRITRPQIERIRNDTADRRSRVDRHSDRETIRNPIDWISTAGLIRHCLLDFELCSVHCYGTVRASPACTPYGCASS